MPPPPNPSPTPQTRSLSSPPLPPASPVSPTSGASVLKGAVRGHRIINGLKAQGTAVRDCKVLFYGAGSSAVGVANMIASLFHKEGGLSEKEAKEVAPNYHQSISCNTIGQLGPRIGCTGFLGLVADHVYQT